MKLYQPIYDATASKKLYRTPEAALHALLALIAEDKLLAARLASLEPGECEDFDNMAYIECLEVADEL
jgi:hypothetical protein